MDQSQLKITCTVEKALCKQMVCVCLTITMSVFPPFQLGSSLYDDATKKKKKT